MITMKTAVVKVVTALVLSLVTVFTMVAYAAAESVNTVTITDGDVTTEFVTYCQTPEEILKDADISLMSGDEVSFSLDGGIGTLNINRSFPVYITVGNDVVMLRMTKGTVATALEKAEITLDEYDICNVNTDTVLTSESYIDIVNIDYTTVSYDEAIPFTTKVEYSSKLAKGEKKVTGGVNGAKTVVLSQRLENGVIVSSEIVSETVTKEPVAQKTVVGTKTSKKTTTVSSNKTVSSKKCISSLKPSSKLKLGANGLPSSYTKSMTFKASAYTSSGSAKCSTGVRPQTGYIAVNPNIIPYGTEMYIVSNDGKYVYGYAIAADTGGFAKKNPYMVDLYFNTESQCVNFGIRNVTIYFL